MTTSTLEILALAKTLQKNADGSEVALRCAVSRAYYAALHTADNIIPGRVAGEVRQESSHECIIGRAQVYGKGVNPGRGAAQTIAKLLPKIKRARVRADYRLHEDVSASDCADVIVTAEMVIDECGVVNQKIFDSCNDQLRSLT